MSSPQYQVRPATEADVADILRLIKELADYEKALDQVEATEELLLKTLFPGEGGHKVASCLVAQESKEDGAVVGMALYFFSYSTWQAKNGLYLEDLYVTPSTRGTGVGKALFRELGKIALQKECGRVGWSVLDWNQSAIDFYEKSIKAKIHPEWQTVRLEGGAEISRLLELA